MPTGVSRGSAAGPIHTPMNRYKILSLTTLCAFVAPAAAQGQILPYLPEGTIVAVSAPDLKTSMAEFQKMPLARMWAESEVQNFFAGIQKMAGEQFEMAMAQAKAMHEQGELPVDPEQLRTLGMGGMSFALTRLELPADLQVQIGVVVHFDFGASAPQWNNLLQIGLGMLEQQAGPMLQKSEKAIGDVKVMQFGDGQSPMSLNVAMLPTGVLLATLPGDVESIVTAMAAKKPALGASPRFAAATTKVATDGAEVVAYMQSSPVFDFVTSALRTAQAHNPDLGMIDVDGVDRALEAMGMKNLGSALAAWSYVDGKAVGKSFVASEKPGTAAVTAPLDMGFLKWVPKQAVSVMASKFDMLSIHDTIFRGLEAYSPEMAEQARQHLGAMEEQLGFKLKDDLFGAFGDHMVSWSMPMASLGSVPEVGMLIKVNNEEGLLKALRSVVAMSEGVLQLEESERRGFKSYQLRITPPDVNEDMAMAFGGMNPFEMFTPSFAFKNGYLVGALSTPDVRRAFTRLDREDDPKGDIRSSKEFELAMKDVPANVVSLSFTDFKAQFDSVYTIVTGALGAIPLPDDVPVDLALLPESSTLTKHLFGSVSYATVDASGTATTSISPIGPEMLLGIVGMLIAGGVAGFAFSASVGGAPMVEEIK